MVDVVVVGAGVSGLRLATLLRAASLSVAVLEARDRVGGRTLSLPRGTASDAATVDLGASWHWPGEHRVAALLRDLSLGASFEHFTTGDALSEGFGGAPERLRGASTGMEGAFRFAGGAQALAHALAAQLPPDTLRLGESTAGVELDEAAQALLVRTRGGAQLRARRAVVLALPPALVPGLELAPPLPARLVDACAMTPTFMGGCVKWVALYDTPFWRDARLSGTAFSRRGPLSEVHDHSPASAGFGALLGFSSASAASAEASREAVLAQLVRLFGERAARPAELLCLDWSAEAHTTPPHAEQSRAQGRGGTDATFAQGAWGGRLLLCSCETATRDGGPHLEGALAAAERAAQQVAALTPL